MAKRCRNFVPLLAGQQFATTSRISDVLWLTIFKHSRNSCTFDLWNIFIYIVNHTRFHLSTLWHPLQCITYAYHSWAPHQTLKDLHFKHRNGHLNFWNTTLNCFNCTLRLNKVQAIDSIHIISSIDQQIRQWFDHTLKWAIPWSQMGI